MGKASSYKIRSAVVKGTNGTGYRQYTVSLPPEIGAPLYEAGFRVRYEVRDDGILIIPIPSDEREPEPDTHAKVIALVERFSTPADTHETDERED